MNIAPRIALALASGIFIAVWFASVILRLMPAMQFAFCTGPAKGVMCTVSALLFGYAYYAALTLPIAAALLAVPITRMLGKPGPQGNTRPAALTLGIVLLLAGALFHVMSFAVELLARLGGSRAAVASLVVTPLLAVGGFAAAWLLWRMRENGRRLALLVLLATIVSALWNAMQYPATVTQSPVSLVVLALRVALFVYLLMPKVRAGFQAAS